MTLQQCFPTELDVCSALDFMFALDFTDTQSFKANANDWNLKHPIWTHNIGPLMQWDLNVPNMIQCVTRSGGSSDSSRLTCQSPASPTGAKGSRGSWGVQPGLSRGSREGGERRLYTRESQALDDCWMSLGFALFSERPMRPKKRRCVALNRHSSSAGCVQHPNPLSQQAIEKSA